MSIATDPRRLPFNEAIEFFREKVRLPTAAWTDLWEGMHTRAFVVAGAQTDELLADFQSAILKAKKQGTGYRQFLADFDDIVRRHGWSYNGGRGWRSRVIYRTNMRTAYQAGRYWQMTAIADRRPYWRYHHSDFARDPRPHHVALDGLVLRWDDPFWNTHYPPNGWGCLCKVFSLSDEDVKRRSLKLGQAPEIRWREVTVGSRGPSPRTVRVPEGIDPGWAYNVGEAAWGRPLAEEAMATWRATGTEAWERLTAGSWQELGRPQRIPLDPPRAAPWPAATSIEELTERLTERWGGEERIVSVDQATFPIPITLNTRAIAEHVPLDRSTYLPFLEEAITDPFEVWSAFDRHRGTGKVELRMRLIKAIQLDRGRSLLVVANAKRGQFEGWTVIPTSRWGYLNRQRAGKLVFARQ